MLTLAAALIINAAALTAAIYGAAFGDGDPKWQNEAFAVAGFLGLFAIVVARFG